MRTIPPLLAAHLAGGATTLATCWLLARRDGIRLGFTDHDRDLVVDGVTCRAATGFDGSDATAELGLSVTGGEVAGALSDAGLNDGDIDAGLYHGARVETWMVNWSDPSQTMRMAVGWIGEIRRADGAFTAELRSVAQQLNQEQGRLFAKACDADLGDGRCRVDLTLPAWRGAASVATSDGAMRITTTGLGTFAADLFERGRLSWIGGANAGASTEVKAHRLEAGVATLDLWRPSARPIVAGDAFVVTAGCDKRFATCRDRFANSLNFRGFPHIPGNDKAMATAQPGGRHDGSSLQR
jgi:uncharacterized phage protein (TIGR02218 family)